VTADGLDFRGPPCVDVAPWGAEALREGRAVAIGLDLRISRMEVFLPDKDPGDLLGVPAPGDLRDAFL